MSLSAAWSRLKSELIEPTNLKIGATCLPPTFLANYALDTTVQGPLAPESLLGLAIVYGSCYGLFCGVSAAVRSRLLDPRL
jgi:hypothetical protein